MRYYTVVQPHDTDMGYSLVFEPHREEWVCHGIFVYEHKHYSFQGSLSLYQSGNDCDAFFMIEELKEYPDVYQKLIKCIDEHSRWLSLNWCYQSTDDVIMMLNQDPVITRETIQQWQRIGDLTLPWSLCQKEVSNDINVECSLLI